MNWTSFEAFPVQTCALDLKPMQYVRFREGLKRTRLTYNCAHLRSTKESLTFEYLDILFLYHVSIGCPWLIHDGTGSVQGGTVSVWAVLVGSW